MKKIVLAVLVALAVPAIADEPVVAPFSGVIVPALEVKEADQACYIWACGCAGYCEEDLMPETPETEEPVTDRDDALAVS